MILHVFKYLFLNIEFFLSAFYLNYMSSIVFYIIPTEQIFVCPRLQLTVNFEKIRVFFTRRRLNQKKKKINIWSQWFNQNFLGYGKIAFTRVP